jgi:hypothetical protein
VRPGPGRLRKSIDRIASPESKALDILLEIEIAGSAELGFDVVTMEPDVLGTSPAGDLTCACKHPDTMDGARTRSVDGAKQIAKQEHPGVVVVSLDSVFHEPSRFLGVGPGGAARRLRALEAVRDARIHRRPNAGVLLA